MAYLYEVTPRQLIPMISQCLAAGKVPFIQGSPGTGKSAICKQVADSFNIKLIDHRVTSMAPEDFNGLPSFNKGMAVYAPFEDIFPLAHQELPKDKQGWLLLLDEFNSGDVSVHAASYKLLLDRMVGQHHLHENVAIVLAGNNDDDRAITNELSTALQSRVIRFKMVINPQEWIKDVAIPQGYDPRVIAFINTFPTLLNDFVPTKQDFSYCCPRSWETVSELAKQEESDAIPDNKIPLYAGAITPAVANQFITFTRHSKAIIPVDLIVSNPSGTKLPDSRELHWVQVVHLATNTSEKTFEAILEYVSRMPLDCQAVFVLMVKNQIKNISNHPAMMKAALKLARYLS